MRFNYTALFQRMSMSLHRFFPLARSVIAVRCEYQFLPLSSLLDQVPNFAPRTSWIVNRGGHHVSPWKDVPSLFKLLSAQRRNRRKRRRHRPSHNTHSHRRRPHRTPRKNSRSLTSHHHRRTIRPPTRIH